MKKILIILLCFSIFVVVLLCSQQVRDELCWLRTKIGDRAVDYAQYLKSQPNGWHIYEANQLYEQRSWSEATAVNTIEHYQNYLRLHPQGLHLNEAQERIDQLRWQNAFNRNTIQSLEQYMKLHPEGKYTAEAGKKIEELIWREALSSNKVGSYQQYLKLYPRGNYVKEARDKIEDLIWYGTISNNNIKNMEEYLRLYPAGKYAGKAREQIQRLSHMYKSTWPIYVDSFHLYELTAYDEDYGYIFEKMIKQVLSDSGYTFVSNRPDAAVHLQIGYGLSFRDGKKAEDNLSRFINNRWRGKALVTRKLSEPTFDLSCHLYLWDVEHECLIGFYSFGIFPAAGNALKARDVGRDPFLSEMLGILIEDGFLYNLKFSRGTDGVMCAFGGVKNAFYRPDIGKPAKRVFVDFDYGPISVYYWRDSNFERSLYYVLQQAGWDCIGTKGRYDCALKVQWSKYSRVTQIKTEQRTYGLKAAFSISIKDSNQVETKIFSEDVISDPRPLMSYGLNPAEIVYQWRSVYDGRYISGKIVKALDNYAEQDRRR